ncbi:MAG: glycoside hydrolase family 2 [Bacillales bacterium]|jgi:beta-galactosidase/beta-glucuronidase|nr:glycoside hydrolase family 2 [Bacillales bacterium]
MRKEYPRPQFCRSQWLSLNGEYDFSFDSFDLKYLKKGSYPLKIQVPFTYETLESGINDKTYHPTMWYRKEFTVPFEKDKNVLLSFVAVDYKTIIYLNSEYVGTHEGGYDSFSFEVSKFLKYDRVNELVIYVEDDNSLNKPRGKQFWKDVPEGCWYPATSGIWGSVWLETFNKDYLKKILITPDVDLNSVSFEAYTSGGANKIKYEIFYKGILVKAIEENIVGSRVLSNIHLSYESGVDEVHLWWPNNPNLYDLVITLLKDDEVLDRVTTYFGLRKVHVDANGYIFLNNIKIYQKLILDQGYYADTGLTAPNIETIKNDIVLAKQAGFNGARKHQKVDDPYFYYYADQLGYLVWAELPSAYEFNQEEIFNIVSDYKKLILSVYNFPSVIAYVPLNESWGVRKMLVDKEQQNLGKTLYYLSKTLDPSRLVSINDGWEAIQESDIIGIHDYHLESSNWVEKFATDNLQTLQASHRQLFANDNKYLRRQAVMLTEFGGLTIAPLNSDKSQWGYHQAKNVDEFISVFSEQIKNIYKCNNLQGFCYTQLSDVYQETNGLLDFNHKPKLNLDEIRKIIEQVEK